MKVQARKAYAVQSMGPTPKSSSTSSMTKQRLASATDSLALCANAKGSLKPVLAYTQGSSSVWKCRIGEQNNKIKVYDTAKFSKVSDVIDGTNSY